MSRSFFGLEEARQVVSNPSASEAELERVRVFYPELRSEIVTHPAATPVLLQRIATGSDPMVAQAARLRLAGLDEASPAPEKVIDAPEKVIDAPEKAIDAPEKVIGDGLKESSHGIFPQLKGVFKTRRYAFMALSLVIVIVLILVNFLRPDNVKSESEAERPRVSDFGGLPGVRVVDVKKLSAAGIGDTKEWTTTFVNAEGSGHVIAISHRSPEFYLEQLENSRKSLIPVESFDFEYRVGYEMGEDCLKRQKEWNEEYANAQGIAQDPVEYCLEVYSTYSDPDFVGRKAFLQAVQGKPNDPHSLPERPVQLDWPADPGAFVKVTAIDVHTGAVAWEKRIDDLWGNPCKGEKTSTSGHECPRFVSARYGDGVLAIELRSSSDVDLDSSAQLVIVRVSDGEVLGNREFDFADFFSVLYVSKNLVLVKQEEEISAYKVGSGMDEKWSEDVGSGLETCYVDDGYLRKTILLEDREGYVEFCGKYLKISNGDKVDVKKNSGRYRYATTIPGFGRKIVEVSNGGGFETQIARFNPGDEYAKWIVKIKGRIDPQREGVRMYSLKDDKIVLVGSKEVVLYRVAKEEAEELWSYAYGEFGWIAGINDSRLVLQSDEGLTVVDMLDGSVVGKQKIRKEGEHRIGESVILGTQVFYALTEEGEVAGYDTSGLSVKQLWRSPNVSGRLVEVDGVLTVQDEQRGLIGIVGGEGADWGLLAPAG